MITEISSLIEKRKEDGQKSPVKEEKYNGLV